jgi:hypothetical protein
MNAPVGVVGIACLDITYYKLYVARLSSAIFPPFFVILHPRLKSRNPRPQWCGSSLVFAAPVGAGAQLQPACD